MDDNTPKVHVDQFSIMIADENRDRPLLGMMAVPDSESDLYAILHSVSLLLSAIVGCKCVALVLLNEGGRGARLYVLDLRLGPSNSPAVRDVPMDAALCGLINGGMPRCLRNVPDELAAIPDLIQMRRFEPSNVAHVFPVSSAQQRPGILVFITNDTESCSARHLEVMTSATVLISKFLDTALAFAAAESYKQTLARERDRFKLLLEINNHTIAHLEMGALFRAASKSLYSFFDNSLTGFWLFAEKSSQLELSTLEFPTGLGFRENTTTAILQKDEVAIMSARVATMFGPEDINQLPGTVAKALRENGILSVLCVPLVGTKGLLGVISLGSKQKDAFNQDDLELLSQIANQISLALDNALAYRRMTFSCRRLEEERKYLESEFQIQDNFEDIVGQSAAVKHVLEQASIVAPTDSTVLLIGESGTGKELVARAIHKLSLRRERTFVRLNCAAVPSGLIESELFGHEKGAFTGALAQKRGRIELAHEGSLFLDEIGDIGLELQPKLLRVLQEREFERLGSNHTIKVDTRLIAATHRDLPGMVRKEEFREDLFYRLNVFPIHIPPLRERKEDIPLLVHYFVASLSRKLRKSIRIIPPWVMTAMTSFNWPGNIRELQNFIERSVILSRDETLAAPISELNDAMVPRDIPASTLHGMEREMILNVLRAAGGKLSGSGGAAERLGLKRTTLQRKMERLGIRKSDYASTARR
jgi:formate hydrogenlyase transcriptional activator